MGDQPPNAPPPEPIEELEEIDEDPDVRFSYANERTFLAWNRTALALVTAGLAITQLLPPFDVPGGRRMIGLPLIFIGTLVSVASFSQWQRNERAMRAHRPLPRSVLPKLVAAVVAASAVIALVLATVQNPQ
jgi:putative membrane protein